MKVAKAVIKFRARNSFITLQTECLYDEREAKEKELIRKHYTIVCSYKKYV